MRGCLDCFLRFNRLYMTRRWFIVLEGKLWMFIFLEEDLTWLPYYPYRTNQGSICFHSFTYFTFTFFNWTLGTMFILSVREGKWWYLIGYNCTWVCLFDGRCVKKLWQTLVSVILAPNLNFFTTFRSETLALASVSWIGVV